MPQPNKIIFYFLTFFLVFTLSLSFLSAWNFDSNDVTVTSLTGNFSNISQAIDTDITYPVTDDFVLTWDATTSNWVAENAAAVGDTNETVRFEVLIGTDCAGTDKMVGVAANGAVVCEADEAINTSYYLVTNPDNYWNDTYATWNESFYYANATGTFALIGSGGGIVWADVVNGTVVLQEDYDANYSANNEAWLNTTNSSYVTYLNLSNSYVNASDNWDSLDSTNSSQFQNNEGVLDILTSYLSEAFNSFFGLKTTDDLVEGSTNLYDNQSWNQSHYYENATGTFALIGEGGGITWANVVNGTVVLQADYDANYSANNEAWLNTTNSTYNAYNATGLIRDWNASNFIIDWNATGYIRDWTGDITDSNTTLYNWILGQGYVTWAEATNGTLFTTALYNINYSANYLVYVNTTNSSYVTYLNLSNSYVNASDNWDSYDTTNSSQISNTGGVLTILTTYLSEVFDTLFGGKDTDDLAEGSSNLYDNTSWNQEVYYTNATASFAILGSEGIAWADVVNGTVVLQADYDANYSANDAIYRNRTNSTYHAYNATGLIRDWNVSGYIQDWNASSFIIDWNATGYIKDWTGDITDSNTTLYNWVVAQGYITWADVVNGTVVLQEDYDANYSANDAAYRSIINTSYYLESNPYGYLNTTINTSYVTYYNLSNSYVNSSDNWDSYDTTNSSQISNTGGVLTILTTYLSEVFDTLFGGKDTDDLAEGSSNLYDNTSWSQTVYYANATASFALWVDVVNGTVMLQTTYNTNYSVNDEIYRNRTNSTYHAYNLTGLIRDWNVSGYISDWNASNFIIDWNATGYIKDWTGDITDANTTLYNWIVAQGYTADGINWTDATNGTLFTTALYNANYSVNDADYRVDNWNSSSDIWAVVDNGTYVTYDNLSNSYVNSSDNWDSYDTTNSSQISNVGGVLTILTTYLSEVFNTLFGNKDTDDLAEGSSNLYDNQSWNIGRAGQEFVNLTGDIMTGSLNISGGNITLSQDFFFCLTQDCSSNMTNNGTHTIWY